MGVTMRVTRALRSARKAIDQENRYAASNYASLPVVINRCQGVHMYDCDGKEYFDFLSAYSAVNQGHCHPGIMQAAVEQLQTCHLTSRAFHNDQLGPFDEYVTNLFGFDRVLPMNTGEPWQSYRPRRIQMHLEILARKCRDLNLCRITILWSLKKSSKSRIAPLIWWSRFKAKPVLSFPMRDT